jgi:glycosyltransferase involved in cell wall biosynthesis
MRVCVVSFKECWQDATGAWVSYGGFPAQMTAIASLFHEMTLVIVGVPPRSGGIPLPPAARIVPMRPPTGGDARRKVSVLVNLPYYLGVMLQHIRAADAVHVPLPGDMPLLALFVACALRKNIVARYGGSWTPNAGTTFMDGVTRMCMRGLAGGRNVMLAAGEGDAPPAPRMHWIFSTALSQRELAGIRPRLDRGLAAPPRLVYVGRLSPEKGVTTLVRAIARLQHEGFTPLPAVTLIGDGLERAALEQLVAELRCQDVIAFAGQLDRSGLSQHLLDADICAQPSLTEGFSKAWLDALAHGVPVLSSAVGAAPAVIGRDGERGWLVPPGDVVAFATALRRALSTPVNWPVLRERCRAYVEGRTLEAWADEIRARCERQWGVPLRNGRAAR